MCYILLSFFWKIFSAEYANLPLIPPFLQPGIINRGYYYSGVNFASAGAGALVETFQGDVSVCAHMYTSHFWNEITVVVICILTCTLAFHTRHLARECIHYVHIKGRTHVNYLFVNPSKKYWVLQVHTLPSIRLFCHVYLFLHDFLRVMYGKLII